MIRKTLILRLEEGLTPRIAARVVRHAQECACKIECETNGGRISMKSLMAVLSLGLGCGDPLTIVLDGEDEQRAAEALEALLTTEGDD